MQTSPIRASKRPVWEGKSTRPGDVRSEALGLTGSRGKRSGYQPEDALNSLVSDPDRAPHAADRRVVHLAEKNRLLRRLAVVLTFLASAGTALCFLGAAVLIANANCEDGCGSDSPWATGARGSTVELWALAIPAFLAACVLVWAVARRRTRISSPAWIAMTDLLIGWCLFTTNITLSFLGDISYWIWLAGLLLASVGGLAAITLSHLDAAADRRAADAPRRAG